MAVRVLLIIVVLAANSATADEVIEVKWPLPVAMSPTWLVSQWPSRFPEIASLEERLRLSQRTGCLIIAESVKTKKMFLCFAQVASTADGRGFSDTRSLGKYGDGLAYVIGTHEIERELGLKIVRGARRCLRLTRYGGGIKSKQYADSMLCESLYDEIPLAGVVLRPMGATEKAGIVVQDPALALLDLYSKLFPDPIDFVEGREMDAPLQESLNQLKTSGVLERLEGQGGVGTESANTQ